MQETAFSAFASHYTPSFCLVYELGYHHNDEYQSETILQHCQTVRIKICSEPQVHFGLEGSSAGTAGIRGMLRGLNKAYLDHATCGESHPYLDILLETREANNGGCVPFYPHGSTRHDFSIALRHDTLEQGFPSSSNCVVILHLPCARTHENKMVCRWPKHGINTFFAGAKPGTRCSFFTTP